MKSKLRLADQWNIGPEINNVQELRAAVLYEYARESKYLRDLVDDYSRAIGKSQRADKKRGASSWHDSYSYIEGVSPILGNMVRAMGAQASLEQPWKSLHKSVRRKMADACRTTVRFAHDRELETTFCWQHFEDAPPDTARFPINWGESDHNGLGLRTICLVVDTRDTAAEIAKGVHKFLVANLRNFVKGATGKGAKSKTGLLKELKGLEVMRLLSNRDPAIAATLADLRGREDLLSGRKTDSARYALLDHARKTFRNYFPRLVNGGANPEFSQMISDNSYRAHKSRGRGRPRRSA